MKTSSSRRLRYDFFRGLALLIICYDHIVFQSNGIPFWGMVTPWYWGFSDAAEIFIFVSGLTFGLVYTRRFDRFGLWASTRKVIVRAWQIYRAYLLLAVLSLGVAIGLTTAGPLSLDLVSDLRAAPLDALTSLVFLRGVDDVLPLYVVLVLLAVPLLALLRRAPAAALAVSGGLYLVSQLAGGGLPVFGDWGFHPLAYQFLFMIGMYVAVADAPLPRHRGVTGGLLLLLVAIGLRIWLVPRLIAHGLIGAESVLNVPIPAWEAQDKTLLAVHRLLYFLGLAYVTAVLTPAANAFWQRRIWRPVLTVGQHALSVYCFGELLAIVVGGLTKMGGLAPTATLLAALGGCLLLVGFAYGMQWWAAPLPTPRDATPPAVSEPPRNGLAVRAAAPDRLPAAPSPNGDAA